MMTSVGRALPAPFCNEFENEFNVALDFAKKRIFGENGCGF